MDHNVIYMETLSYREQVAAEIRAEIARQGRTIRDVAAAAGIPTSTMSRKLRHGAPFDIEELYRISRVLGVATAALIPDKPRMSISA